MVSVCIADTIVLVTETQMIIVSLPFFLLLHAHPRALLCLLVGRMTPDGIKCSPNRKVNKEDDGRCLQTLTLMLILTHCYYAVIGIADQ